MTSAHSKHRRQRDTTASRRRLREDDERVRSALDAARGLEASLDRRMAYEAELTRAALEAALVDATEAEREAARAKAAAVELRAARLRGRWPLGFARDLVRQGYTVRHASRFTGWPARMLEDVKPGQW